MAAWQYDWSVVHLGKNRYGNKKGCGTILIPSLMNSTGAWDYSIDRFFVFPFIGPSFLPNIFARCRTIKRNMDILPGDNNLVSLRMDKIWSSIVKKENNESLGELSHAYTTHPPCSSSSYLNPSAFWRAYWAEDKNYLSPFGACEDLFRNVETLLWQEPVRPWHMQNFLRKPMHT